MFTVHALTQRYQPRPQDAPLEMYQGRMRACSACPLRRAHTCTLANQLVSVLARAPRANCPDFKWPGDRPTARRVELRPPSAIPAVVKRESGTIQKRLRVGLLSPSILVGGVERWWISLCRHWSGGNTIEPAGVALCDQALTTQQGIDEVRRYCRIWGSVHRSPDGRDAAEGITRLESGDAAAALLRAQSDVLLVWGQPDAARFTAGFGGPVVLVSHGTGAWTQDTLARAAPAASHYVAVSVAAAGAFPEKVRDRVVVIPNGIEFDRCAPGRTREDVRAEWGLSDETIAVGYLGRWSPEKNPMAAVWGVSRLERAVAVLAVPRRDREAATADAEKVLAPEKFRAICPDHVGDVFVGLDCLVVASHEEGFAMAILEAFAAGVPVVATPVGAVPETEAVYGPLVERIRPDPSPEQLAAAISAATRPAARDRAAVAREIAWKNHSAARMAALWERFLLHETAQRRKADVC